MGVLSTVLGILGFGIGVPLGILVGFFLFVYSEPQDVKDPVSGSVSELETANLEDLVPEIPLWVKNPDYDRVDWLNNIISYMWPYLDKAICDRIRVMTQPVFAEYAGKFQIKAIELDILTLGTLPLKIFGLKAFDTNENELIMEPTIRWAGNPNIVLVVKMFFDSIPIKVQIVDLQVFASLRIALKPLVPTFPCFSSIFASLMDKPHIDFGLKIIGGDIMAIPGLYRFVQEMIKKQVSNLYLWPQIVEVPILDASIVATKKPVGILHVKVVRASKLLKMDFIGTSDPYVKLSLSGERLPSKKTTIKMKNLNPVWNEKFKLVVIDPDVQVLQLQVFDWDKVGGHDRIGIQFVPLKLLTPFETKELELDLLKNTNVEDPHNKKPRGQLVLELNFAPFREETGRFTVPLKEESMKKEIEIGIGGGGGGGAGLLSVLVQGAHDVEGDRHNNPFAVVQFRGEKKKTKMISKTREPIWNEEFQFMLEEPPLHEKIRVEVVSRRTFFRFRSKESLGHVEINLSDVVHNGRINEKYHLINSRNGVVHVEIRWAVA